MFSSEVVTENVGGFKGENPGAGRPAHSNTPQRRPRMESGSLRETRSKVMATAQTPRRGRGDFDSKEALYLHAVWKSSRVGLEACAETDTFNFLEAT